MGLALAFIVNDADVPYPAAPEGSHIYQMSSYEVFVYIQYF
jgi:hypothetical protein